MASRDDLSTIEERIEEETQQDVIKMNRKETHR